MNCHFSVLLICLYRLLYPGILFGILKKMLNNVQFQRHFYFRHYVLVSEGVCFVKFNVLSGWDRPGQVLGKDHFKKVSSRIIFDKK